MTDLLTALALILVIEGLMLVLLADRMRALLAQMAELPPDVLRIAGLVSAALGLLFVWLLRS